MEPTPEFYESSKQVRVVKTYFEPLYQAILSDVKARQTAANLRISNCPLSAQSATSRQEVAQRRQNVQDFRLTQHDKMWPTAWLLRCVQKLKVKFPIERFYKADCFAMWRYLRGLSPDCGNSPTNPLNSSVSSRVKEESGNNKVQQ